MSQFSGFYCRTYGLGVSGLSLRVLRAGLGPGGSRLESSQ